VEMNGNGNGLIQTPASRIVMVHRWSVVQVVGSKFLRLTFGVFLLAGLIDP
jgi:hypothetical protein